VNSRELNLIAEQSDIKLLADKRTLESFAVFGINTRERN
jgi:hypothetical protein